MNIRLGIVEIAGAESLAGAGPGLQLMSKLIAALPPPQSEPQVIFLDARGAEMITASYMREAFFGLRTWIRKERPDLYPVIANAASAIVEDIAIVAAARGPILTCALDRRGKVSAVQLVGQLDPKARLAFECVNKLRETTVRDLVERQFAEDAAKPTAWNNRLAALVELGLVIETTAGRTNVYRPVVVED